MPERAPMTGWFDPRRLLSIGIRVAEATVFGQMFDRRELMASLDPFDQNYFDDNFDFTARPASSGHPQPRNYTDENGDFWFDFAADTGDGWIPVYAVARLLARHQLNVGGSILPQGRVLVFGGDQVYPTPSEEDYRMKLQAPFTEANLRENTSGPAFNRDRHVFAIPGNHDWYDDLTSFARLFCNKAPDRPGSAKSPGRPVCGRQTHQTRSYFALKFPSDWWLCAFDAQLEGYIDAPQLRFFEYVAQNLMTPGSNVILCCPGPVWAYSRWGRQAKGFSNFAFASLIVTGAVGYDGYRPQRQHNLRLVLTGDSHHYAHFIEKASDYSAADTGVTGSTAEVHYLTCGLGGAFTHPTHWLVETTPRAHWRPAPPLLPYDPTAGVRGEYLRKFSIASGPQGEQSIFPDHATSRRMTWWNLLFVWFNPWFGVFVGLVGLFATWLLHFGALVENTSLADLLRSGSIWTGAQSLFLLLLDTPWPWVIIVSAFAALRYFADFEERPIARTITGIAHTAAHVLAYCLLLLLLARMVPRDGWLLVAMGIVTGLVSPFIMGAYLITMLSCFGRHWDQAYSSLRIEDFKGFLRLKIDRHGDLTVYPIGLDTVPRTDDGELAPRFLERPITVPKSLA